MSLPAALRHAEVQNASGVCSRPPATRCRHGASGARWWDPRRPSPASPPRPRGGRAAVSPSSVTAAGAPSARAALSAPGRLTRSVTRAPAAAAIFHGKLAHSPLRPSPAPRLPRHAPPLRSVRRAVRPGGARPPPPPPTASRRVRVTALHLSSRTRVYAVSTASCVPAAPSASPPPARPTAGPCPSACTAAGLCPPDPVRIQPSRARSTSDSSPRLIARPPPRSAPRGNPGCIRHSRRSSLRLPVVRDVA